MKTLFALAFLVLIGRAASASEIVTLHGNSITSYDCSFITVKQHHGKCVISLAQSANETGGKGVEFLASPEVAAPWSNGYGESASRPMIGLTMIFDGEEIIHIADRDGRKISTKIDFSR